jgi:hypothetical protein
LAYRKPEPQPALLGREEGIKDTLELVGVDALPAVKN